MNRFGLLLLFAFHVRSSEIYEATGLESESASFWNRLGRIQKRLGPDTDNKLKPVTCSRNGVSYAPSDEGFAKNCGYETKANTIIKTRDSMKNGAIFLKHIEAQNTSSCIITCCCTESCDLAVFKNKDEHSCYLFHCGQPNKCQFGHQEKYVSLTFPTMQHSEKTFATEEEQKLHEDELEGLHKDTSDVKPAEMQVIPTTLSSTPVQTTTTAARPAVPLYGFCYKGDNCVDSQAVCRESFCMCVNGYHAKFGQCRQLCQPHQFECDNGQDGPDCIDSGLTCDGTPQCADGSDEDSCKPPAEDSDEMESQLPGPANKPHTADHNFPDYDYYYQPVEYSNIHSESKENFENHKGDKDEPHPPATEKERYNLDDSETVKKPDKNRIRDPQKNSSASAEVSLMKLEETKEASPMHNKGMQQAAGPAQHKEESMAKPIHMKPFEEHVDDNQRNGYGESSMNDNMKSDALKSSKAETELSSEMMSSIAQYQKDGSLEGEAMDQGHHVAQGRISNNRGRYNGVNTEDGHDARHDIDEAADAHNSGGYPSNHNVAMTGRDGYHDEDASIISAGNRHHGDTADAMDNTGSQGNSDNAMAAEGRHSVHHGKMKDRGRYNSEGDKQIMNSKGQPSRNEEYNSEGNKQIMNSNGHPSRNEEYNSKGNKQIMNSKGQPSRNEEYNSEGNKQIMNSKGQPSRNEEYNSEGNKKIMNSKGQPSRIEEYNSEGNKQIMNNKGQPSRIEEYNSEGNKQIMNSKGQPSRNEQTGISSHKMAEGGNKNIPVEMDRRPHMQESMNQNGRQQWPNWSRDEQRPKYQPPAGRDPSYDYSNFDRYYPDYAYPGYKGQQKYPDSYYHHNQADRLGDNMAGLKNEPDRNGMKHHFDPSIENQDTDHQDSGESNDGIMEANMNEDGPSNNDASDLESHEAEDGAIKKPAAMDNADDDLEAEVAHQDANKETSISPRATTSHPPLVKKGEPVEIKLNELYTQKKIISPTSNAQGPIIALSLGLGITFFLLVIVGCRFRNMKRRLRRGRPLHSNEADYLINGMYL